MTSLPDISVSAQHSDRPSSPHSNAIPLIVAESLASVSDPVVTALRPGPWLPADEVARAMARRLAPDEAPDAAPGWLRPEQVRSFRRSLFAIRQHGAALLADPVGSGKTYIALAVATAIGLAQPTVCLVPAPLAEQWRATARQFGLAIVVATHQAASRGRLPAVKNGLVVVDEAHHFRNPGTWRYRTVAPWLIGRPVLLVTATPVVNRLTDLLHQLLLGVRDDALAPDGVPSLRALLGQAVGSPALGRLVFESPALHGLQPERRGSVSRPDALECEAAIGALAVIDRLHLSRVAGTETLIRTVLRRAAASSPAALTCALRRYRSLLLHARDAARAGRPFDRAALRRFSGELEDQLVWWELMPAAEDSGELRLDDLERIDDALRDAELAAAAPDGKLERLRSLLADGRPTLIFASRRETVRYLRDRLGPPPPAWCTGTQAGVGHCPMPRATVLGWFRQTDRDAGPLRTDGPAPPRHLVVTDVAAEGLDLQRAGRVVHYDLPWTPMRVEQREGRAVRLGSRHRVVEVVTFTPPAPLDRALRLSRALAMKARLPALAGLGPAGRGLWRWRSELADAHADGASALGTAVVPSLSKGVLAGFELYGISAGVEHRLASTLVWIEPGGEWTDEEQVVAARLAEAAAVTDAPVPDTACVSEAIALIATPIRARLGLARGSRWVAPAADPGTHRVALRLQQGIRVAARRRDLDALAGLERALAFVGRGHTAGEALELERLADLPEAEFSRGIRRLPLPGRRWEAIDARLGGLLLFRSG
jgi:superfamily II DNA or RNA helicase